MIQTEIDSLEYPPSHQYVLEPLTPKGILKERLELMPKDFFKGDSFLDIGCNKGFFTLYADCNYVESIDNEKKYTDLCSKLSKGVVINKSFRDYRPTRQFDRIFIGNVHHYIFRECGGWEWINKLAAISSDLVLIEGPTGLENTTANEQLEGEIREKFTEEKFMVEMFKHFTLISKVNSTYSTKDRYIMLFEKKPVKKIQLDELTLGNPIHDNEFYSVYFIDTMVAKICKKNIDDLIVRINIVKTSPISNGIIGEVYNGDKFVGWLENYDNSLRYGYKENEKELFRLICKHNIYLAKLGYTDTDTATLNFFKNNKLFDKGQVTHVSNIDKALLDMFETQLRRSYDIPDETIHSLTKALQTGDSKVIENTWHKVLFI